MSHCREEGMNGKDKIIFLTKEDYEKPSTVILTEEEEEPGLILDNGDINWSCPCLGGMATGPCGNEFRDAFSCFHYSEEEPKGAECYEAFKNMQECMSQYPDLYDDDKKDENKNENSTVEDIPDNGTDNSYTEKSVTS